MADITLKLDDDLMRYIELAAKAMGQTPEQVAVKVLGVGVKHYGEGRVAISDYIKSLQPKPLEDDSTQIIRRMRDAS